jgi:hypothetical protein
VGFLTWSTCLRVTNTKLLNLSCLLAVNSIVFYAALMPTWPNGCIHAFNGKLWTQWEMMIETKMWKQSFFLSQSKWKGLLSLVKRKLFHRIWRKGMVWSWTLGALWKIKQCPNKGQPSSWWVPRHKKIRKWPRQLYRCLWTLEWPKVLVSLWCWRATGQLLNC